MLSVWGVHLVGGGKGWVGCFVYGREGWGVVQGGVGWEGIVILEMIQLGSGSMDFSARINPHAPQSLVAKTVISWKKEDCHAGSAVALALVGEI